MMGILEKILEIVQDLIPDKSQPNHIWMSRISLLLLASTGIFFGWFAVIQNTVIGEKYGINSTNVHSSGKPPIVEYAIRQRRIIDSLSTFKDSQPGAVDEVLLAVSIQPKLNLDKHFVLLGWSLPVETTDDIKGFEFLLNEKKELFTNTSFTKSRDCVTQKVTPELLVELTKINSKNLSTFYTVCPIQDLTSENNNAFTVGFFNAKDFYDAGILGYRQRLLTESLRRDMYRLSKLTD
jgi:hypothetical protein